MFPVVAVVAILLASTAAPFVGPAGRASAGGSFASFGERQVHEQRGDVANITVKTSQAATVNIGSPSKGFWLQLRVGGGTTKLNLNTFKAGESNRYALSEMVWATKGSVKSRTLKTRSIEGPLDVADYQMNVTINGQEQALGTLFIEERETRDITARIAPRATNVEKLETGSDMRAASVPPVNGSVARDDWLLLEIKATGLDGALSKSRLDGDGGIMAVEFRQTNPKMNKRPNEFTGASVERLFTDESTEGFYLAVDTGEHGIQPGDRYNVSFVVPADSRLADEREVVSTTIRVLERRVDIVRRGPGDAVVVEGETKIEGSTTLTPGTTINISARGTGAAPFLIPKTVTVGSDRTFAVTMDFSDVEPGRQFEIRLPDQRRRIPAVVEIRATTTTATTKTTTRTTTTSPTTTPTPQTTTPPDGDGNGTATTENATTATTTVEGLTQVAVDATGRPLTEQSKRENTSGDDGSSGLVPGLDALSAVLALLAAALLATRR